MTEKDRIINDAINRILGIVRDGISPVEYLEKAVAELFDAGYDIGYKDGYDVAVMDELDSQKFSFR